MAPKIESRKSMRTEIYEATPHYVHGILCLICVCYFGKYYCTSDMYVVQKLFQGTEGISDIQLSNLFAVGYFFSMFGKISAGIMSDAYGGRPVMFLSAGGYIICAVLFSLVPTAWGFPAFVVVWAGIGYFALGLSWVACVAVATNWIPVSHLGRLMSILSMAPQLGDVMARITLAKFLDNGWRTVFQIAAGTAAVFTLPIICFVQNSPDGAEDTIQHAKKEAKEEKSFMTKLSPLLKNPLLWILCLLSGSLYGTRTLFLLYSTSFLSAVRCNGNPSDSEAFTECLKLGDTMAATATASSVYTLMGCVSVGIVGVLKDKLPKKHRAASLALFGVPLFLSMAFMAYKGTDMSFGLAVALVANTGFCLFGPYKVLGGVFAVDVGGKELKSTACSFMGVFDNLFAMCMLFVKGSIGGDWNKMFVIVSGLSLMSLVCASIVWHRDLAAAKAPKTGLSEPLITAVPPCTDNKAAAIYRRQSFHDNKEQQ